MPSKTIDVKQLEGDLAAANAIIRQISESLGVKFKPVTQSTAVESTAKIMAALERGSPSNGRGRAPSRGRLSGGDYPQLDDDELDEEIDRAQAAQAEAGGTTALQHRPAPNQRNANHPDLLEQIGHELGVNLSGLPTSDGLEVILQELQRVKGSGDIEGSGPASKGDTLAEAIAHNAKTGRHLNEELTRNRSIVNRVAAAMQIPQWDADGTELLERIQRWESFKYQLQARVKELENTGKDDAAAELSTQLAVVMGGKAFSAWLKGKPPKTVNATVAALAIDMPTGFREFLPGDIIRIHKLLTDALERDSLTDWLRDDFHALASSVTASTEFCRLMNLVVLPLLVKQGLLLPNRIPRQ